MEDDGFMDLNRIATIEEKSHLLNCNLIKPDIMDKELSVKDLIKATKYVSGLDEVTDIFMAFTGNNLNEDEAKCVVRMYFSTAIRGWVGDKKVSSTRMYNDLAICDLIRRIDRDKLETMSDRLECTIEFINEYFRGFVWNFLFEHRTIKELAKECNVNGQYIKEIVHLVLKSIRNSGYFAWIMDGRELNSKETNPMCFSNYDDNSLITHVLRLGFYTHEDIIKCFKYCKTIEGCTKEIINYTGCTETKAYESLSVFKRLGYIDYDDISLSSSIVVNNPWEELFNNACADVNRGDDIIDFGVGCFESSGDIDTSGILAMFDFDDNVPNSSKYENNQDYNDKYPSVNTKCTSGNIDDIHKSVRYSDYEIMTVKVRGYNLADCQRKAIVVIDKLCDSSTILSKYTLAEDGRSIDIDFILK